jgi:hypothetical protein
MSWTTVFTTIVEAAADEVENARKREERAAKKLREESLEKEKGQGGILAVDLSREDATPVKVNAEEEKEKAFVRIWKTVSCWCTRALDDAVEFAKEHEPRDKETIERLLEESKESQPLSSDAVSSKFARSVWPSLKSRGWSAVITDEGDAAGETRYLYKGQEVRIFPVLISTLFGKYFLLSLLLDFSFLQWRQSFHLLELITPSFLL